MRHKRGRSTHYFWTAERAEVVVVRFTPEVRTELRNLARRFGDAELGAICERASDREALLNELDG